MKPYENIKKQDKTDFPAHGLSAPHRGKDIMYDVGNETAT